MLRKLWRNVHSQDTKLSKYCAILLMQTRPFCAVQMCWSVALRTSVSARARVCLCVCVQVRVFAFLPVCVSIRACVRMFVCAFVLVCLHACTCVLAFLSTCARGHMCVCVCVYVCVCVCVCVCGGGGCVFVSWALVCVLLVIQGAIFWRGQSKLVTFSSSCQTF